LELHVDDAEITLNLCLGARASASATDNPQDSRGFTGGELQFGGQRCQMHQNTILLEEEQFQLDHVPGVAVLHMGAHRHAALPLSG